MLHQPAPAIYLAGPDVFLPDALNIGRRKKALCQAYGFTGLFPFDHEPDNGDGSRLNHAIYTNNRRMIAEADIGLFHLTPFRGPSADPGTVFELGMMAGLGKPVFGYTTVTCDLRDRVLPAALGADGIWRDAQGYTVENFGNADNLMIDSCLAESGGLLRVDGGGRLDDLDAFEKCLRHVTAWVLKS